MEHTYSVGTLGGRGVAFEVTALNKKHKLEERRMAKIIPEEVLDWIENGEIIKIGTGIQKDMEMLGIHYRSLVDMGEAWLYYSTRTEDPLIKITNPTGKSGVGIQAVWALGADFKPMVEAAYLSSYGDHDYRLEGQRWWPPWKVPQLLYLWRKNRHGMLTSQSIAYLYKDCITGPAVVAKLIMEALLEGRIAPTPKDGCQALVKDVLRPFGGSPDVLYIDERYGGENSEDEEIYLDQMQVTKDGYITLDEIGSDEEETAPTVAPVGNQIIRKPPQITEEEKKKAIDNSYFKKMGLSSPLIFPGDLQEEPVHAGPHAPMRMHLLWRERSLGEEKVRRVQLPGEASGAHGEGLQLQVVRPPEGALHEGVHHRLTPLHALHATGTPRSADVRSVDVEIGGGGQGRVREGRPPRRPGEREDHHGREVWILRPCVRVALPLPRVIHSADGHGYPGRVREGV